MFSRIGLYAGVRLHQGTCEDAQDRPVEIQREEVWPIFTYDYEPLGADNRDDLEQMVQETLISLRAGGVAGFRGFDDARGRLTFTYATNSQRCDFYEARVISQHFKHLENCTLVLRVWKE